MIDFHSHILPGIDDGAKNSRMSLEMLSASLDAGVSTIIATPHCYISADTGIQDFLKDRESSYKRLNAAAAEYGEELPEIILGSEVRIYPDMCRNPELDKLCIANTNYILLEMPYEPWKDWMYEEVYEVSRMGLRPILAHLDRYVSLENDFSNLYSIDALFQINASAFINKNQRRQVLEFFANDAAHVIGSDMHNMTTRPPNLAEAYDIIEKKFGWEYVDYLKHNSHRIIQNDATLPTLLPRLGFFKKLFI